MDRTPTNPEKLDFARELDFDRVLTNPILDIAARLWETDRYEAFRVCYRSMRRIDDLVDERKETGQTITRKEVERYGRLIVEWLDAVRRGDSSDPFRRAFLDVLRRFAIPFWPWERLYQAMAYDLKHDGYASFHIFLRYTEGAAIAPASVFIHLCGIENGDDGCRPPTFDIRKAARPLAVFSYLVHILRDFQKDQLNNLTYYADSVLRRFGLRRDSLRAVAEGEAIDQPFRSFMAAYRSFADYYRLKARERLTEVLPQLGPRYQLSLEMIYQLYLQIFERVDPENGSFTTDELNPAPAEIKARIERTISTFVPVTL